MWPGTGGEEFLGELKAVGVGRVVIPMMGQGDPVERLTTIAEEVIKSLSFEPVKGSVREITIFILIKPLYKIWDQRSHLI